jgi:hypothetical protein
MLSSGRDAHGVFVEDGDGIPSSLRSAVLIRFSFSGAAAMTGLR